MKFAIITHVVHKKKHDNFFAYEPYVREMNLWLQNVTHTKIVAPIVDKEILNIETAYNGNKITFKKIPSFNILSLKNKINSVLIIPIILWEIFKACYWADHIHLRCPGNIGLLGCFVQILFPFKKKTVKYAGNWDPKSKQPFSYRLQKWIVSNTFLTRNCKVLVYGDWKNQSKNIIPFFTATYLIKEIENIQKKDLKNKVKCIFVGSFSKNKQPLLSIKVVESLLAQGFNISLDLYGDGEEFSKAKKYIIKNNLSQYIVLKGNQSKDTIKKAFQESHFLLFFSKSEGWPKVVAEAMFWGCIPVSTKVSCVPQMLNNGKRGSLIKANLNTIVSEIKLYFNNDKDFTITSNKARDWSQKYTLDYFSNEIKTIISK
jgi:glycosyltransferase involved in cell wall biosynthesis